MPAVCSGSSHESLLVLDSPVPPHDQANALAALQASVADSLLQVGAANAAVADTRREAQLTKFATSKSMRPAPVCVYGTCTTTPIPPPPLPQASTHAHSRSPPPLNPYLHLHHPPSPLSSRSPPINQPSPPTPLASPLASPLEQCEPWSACPVCATGQRKAPCCGGSGRGGRLPWWLPCEHRQGPP
jgi:hypothetical protein